MVLDIHTHRDAPYPQGVISVDINDFSPLENQLYSTGIHPWNTDAPMPEDIFERLEIEAASPGVAAIGEAGIDPNKGAPLFKQLQIFKRQAEIADKVGKPLIIHMVKSADIILGLKRDLAPSHPWIIHGFRGKPALAAQLTKAGIYLSFGENFNPDGLRATPPGRILSETDESRLTIEEIIERLSTAYGKNLTEDIAANISTVLATPVPLQAQAH